MAASPQKSSIEGRDLSRAFGHGSMRSTALAGVSSAPPWNTAPAPQSAREGIEASGKGFAQRLTSAMDGVPAGGQLPGHE